VPRRHRVIIEAANVILGRLDKLPESPDALDLREKVLACRQQAEGWKDRPPTVEQHERLMKEVLDLHVRVRRLTRTRSKPPT
jgi:hypothetical protein